DAPTWRETFVPGMLDRYESNGHVYAVPFDMSVQLFWYNVDLFEQHGWEPPETWPEFLALCRKVKEAGIAPIAFQGRYPTYASFIFLDLLTNLGGTDAIRDCENLEPGAWERPEVIEAARLLKELADEYFQEGCMGMSHTEAQMEFVNGRAAIVPCGTWLKSEMKNALPEDFRMSCFKTPRIERGKGDGMGVQVSAAYWIVPGEGKHPEVGVEFLRFMTSQENARDFARKKWTIMAIKGCGQDLTPELARAVQILESASSRHTDRLADWYPVWNEKFTDAMTALLNGGAAPEDFAKRLERAAEEIRNDPWVQKHHVTG
ncbi:MAG: extracellular solute-binding protein, partial [Armatimonadota bacterium]